jgi:hypothetical protein
MTSATMKTKTQNSAKPSLKKAEFSASKKRGAAAKSSPWKAVVIFLIFAGLVAYMFSPNVPDSQRSGNQNSSDSGFAKSLTK